MAEYKKSASEMTCDERVKAGIRRDGKPRAASARGYARLAREIRRKQAEARNLLTLPERRRSARRV